MSSYAANESYLLIDELEEALASGDGRDCEKIIQSVADLFMAGSRRYSDDQIALFDDVLLRLAAEIEMKARAKLAQRLAWVEQRTAQTDPLARLRRGDRRSKTGAFLLAAAERCRPGRKCQGQEPGPSLCHRSPLDVERRDHRRADRTRQRSCRPRTGAQHRCALLRPRLRQAHRPRHCRQRAGVRNGPASATSPASTSSS